MSTATPPDCSRILGIDPGTARVGWGVIDHGTSERGVAYGCIETPKEEQLNIRLQQIYREVRALLVEFSPDLVVIERLFFAKNHTTAMNVAEARGVILLALADAAIPYVERTPLQVKMNITGNGTAPKQQVQYMVQQLLALDAIPQPDDAADGLALALSATHEVAMTSVRQLGRE